jgi:hypothetical protein
MGPLAGLAIQCLAEQPEMAAPGAIPSTKWASA